MTIPEPAAIRSNLQIGLITDVECVVGLIEHHWKETLKQRFKSSGITVASAKSTFKCTFSENLDGVDVCFLCFAEICNIQAAIFIAIKIIQSQEICMRRGMFTGICNFLTNFRKDTEKAHLKFTETVFFLKIAHKKVIYKLRELQVIFYANFKN